MLWDGNRPKLPYRAGLSYRFLALRQANPSLLHVPSVLCLSPAEGEWEKGLLAAVSHPLFHIAVTRVSMATQSALGGQELGRAVSRVTLVTLPVAACAEYLRECVLPKQIPGCPTAFLWLPQFPPEPHFCSFLCLSPQ